MATTVGDIYIRGGLSGSFTDISYVQGGWITVASSSTMYSLYHDRLKDGQIIYIQNSDSLYKVTKYIAFETPGYGGLIDSASFTSFTFPGGSVAGTISSSAQIASDISGAFVSLSSSIASRFDTLGGVGGIFALTGSFYSTTNNIQITGSLSVSSGSFEGFKVDNVGRTIIGDSSNLNLQPIEGGILYSSSLFYLGM
jgi:hypothetical protein